MNPVVRTSLLVSALALSALSCAREATGPLDNTWRLLPGHVEPLTVPEFRAGRACRVYLPPGYATSDARYPVLYVHDGQGVFDGDGCMHANRVAEDLIRRGEIEPIIIVAIACGEGDERFHEYTPFATWWWPNSGGGVAYLEAVRDTLKPAIDRRYRTKPDRANTAMAGMSLGGLMAAYAFFTQDSTYGKAAAFSPTYGASGSEGSIFDVVWHPPGARFYQDTGTDDDNGIGSMEALLTRAGFQGGQDLLSITTMGANHSVPAWEHRLPGMLRFLFPPRGGPS